MEINEIKQNAFSMPYTSPSAIKIDYRFKNREYLSIDYETEIDVLKKIIPLPLKVINPTVKFQFINMPDATGFGKYKTASQLIEVEFEGKKGLYAYNMYLDNLAPIAAGREIWGFPEKLGTPDLKVESDTILGTLNYNSVRVATATMGYKYNSLNKKNIQNYFQTTPNYLLKIIPDVNLQNSCICQLVEFFYTDINIIEAWEGPATLQVFNHALAPVSYLPIKKIIGAQYIILDLTIGFGKIIFDYLEQ